MSDLIKRSDAIEAVADYFDLIGFARVYAKSIINKIPSADRPRGEWIRHENPRFEYDRESGDLDAGVYYSCSICGTIPYSRSNFCPNCGADMRGADDE